MLKAMRAQDKKEAQAAQAQDRVRTQQITNHIHLSSQKLDDIDGKVNAVGKSVEKKIDMISTYLIRYFIQNQPTLSVHFAHPHYLQDEQQD